MREDTSDFIDKAMGKYFNFASDEVVVDPTHPQQQSNENDANNRIDPFLIIPGT